MGIVIEIDSRQMEFSSETITIGRSPTAHLSLPADARIADQHAVLRQVSGRWLIEARGHATIRVGDGRPVQFAWLNPGDVIQLTETGPQLTFCPVATQTARTSPAPRISSPVAALAVSPPPVSALQMTPAASPAPRPGFLSAGNHPAVWALGGAVVVLLSVLVTMSLLPRAVSSPSSSAADQTVVVDSPSHASESPPLPAEPSDAVYLVLMSDPYEQLPQTRRVGMAWAVDKRHLMTNASIVGKSLQQKTEVLSQISVQGAAPSATATIIKVSLHPEYQRLVEAHTAASAVLEDLYKIVDDSPEQSIPDDLRSRILAAQNRLADALREELNFDLAILEVDRDLPHVLPVAEDDVAVRLGTELKLIGFPFPKEETLTDPAGSPQPRTATGSVQFKALHTTAGGYWLVKFRDTRPDDVWSGSPVLNRDGRVIGIYCRAYVPVPEVGDPVLPDAHIISPLGPLSTMRGGEL